MDFSKYYFNEEDKFVNLDVDKSGETLGDINTDEKQYKKIVNRIRTQLSFSEVDESVDILLEGKNLEKYRKPIRNILFRYTLNADKLKKFAQTVRGENSFDYNQKSFTIEQMYQHYQSFVKDAVHQKFYQVLFEFIPGGGAAGQIGKGEVYLALLTKLGFPANNKGDLIESDGSQIEVKYSGARFKGSESVDVTTGPSAVKDIENLIGKDIFKNLKKSKTINKEMLSAVLKFIQENPKKVKDGLSIFMNYRKIPFPNEAVGKLILPDSDMNNFMTLILTLQAYGYIKSEDIPKIIFINKDYKFKMLQYSSFNNLYDFIEKNLVNNAGWSSSKSAFTFIVK